MPLFGFDRPLPRPIDIDNYQKILADFPVIAWIINHRALPNNGVETAFLLCLFEKNLLKLPREEDFTAVGYEEEKNRIKGLARWAACILEAHSNNHLDLSCLVDLFMTAKSFRKLTERFLIDVSGFDFYRLDEFLYVFKKIKCANDNAVLVASFDFIFNIFLNPEVAPILFQTLNLFKKNADGDSYLGEYLRVLLNGVDRIHSLNLFIFFQGMYDVFQILSRWNMLSDCNRFLNDLDAWLSHDSVDELFQKIMTAQKQMSTGAYWHADAELIAKIEHNKVNANYLFSGGLPMDRLVLVWNTDPALAEKMFEHAKLFLILSCAGLAIETWIPSGMSLVEPVIERLMRMPIVTSVRLHHIVSFVTEMKNGGCFPERILRVLSLETWDSLNNFRAYFQKRRGFFRTLEEVNQYCDELLMPALVQQRDSVFAEIWTTFRDYLPPYCWDALLRLNSEGLTEVSHIIVELNKLGELTRDHMDRIFSTVFDTQDILTALKAEKENIVRFRCFEMPDFLRDALNTHQQTFEKLLLRGVPMRSFLACHTELQLMLLDEKNSVSVRFLQQSITLEALTQLYLEDHARFNALYVVSIPDTSDVLEFNRGVDAGTPPLPSPIPVVHDDAPSPVSFALSRHSVWAPLPPPATVNTSLATAYGSRSATPVPER